MNKTTKMKADEGGGSTHTDLNGPSAKKRKYGQGTIKSYFIQKNTSAPSVVPSVSKSTEILVEPKPLEVIDNEVKPFLNETDTCTVSSSDTLGVKHLLKPLINVNNLQDAETVTDETFVPNTGIIKETVASTVYDVGNYPAGTQIDDYTKYNLLQNPWKPPDGYVFPYSVHNKQGKQEKKHLNRYHIDKHYWAVYSDVRKGIFCKYCTLFLPSLCGGSFNQNPLNKLVKTPITSFAKLLGVHGDLETHSRSKYYTDAVDFGKDFLKTYQSPQQNILNQVSASRLAQVRENRERLKPILRSVVFLGKQNIPFRGHRDDGELINDTRVDQPSVTRNEGNFRELLRHQVASGDTILETHLQTSSSKATYISKTTQNELIYFCGQEIMDTILQQIRDARFYAVLFDETTDMAHTSQLSLTLRYINDSDVIREDFIEFIDPHAQNYGGRKKNILNYEEDYFDDTDMLITEPKLTGGVLGQTVIQMLQKHSLSLENCVGIGTDGCSVMVSKQHGAVHEIQTEAKYAIRSPCYNHALNLSISKSSDVSSVRNAMGLISEVCSFFNGSGKRNFTLKTVLKSQLIGLCETRWVERHDSVLIFVSELANIIQTLEVITEWDDTGSSTRARSLISSLTNCEFIVTLNSLSEILAVTKPLSKYFQKKSLDVLSAEDCLNDLIATLLQMRENVNEKFHDIFTRTETLCGSLDVELKVPRLSRKQTHRENHPANTPEEYFRHSLFITLIDNIIEDIQHRFNPMTISMFGLYLFMPSYLAKKGEREISNEVEIVSKVVEQYHPILPNLQLTTTEMAKVTILGELQMWKQKWINKEHKCVPNTVIDAFIVCDVDMFPNIKTLLRILGTMPVSVASAERSFSTLRRLKTWMRTNMREELLTSLALLNIHRDINLDFDKIIDRYAKSTRQRDFVL